jgi:hypothetical protein
MLLGDTASLPAHRLEFGRRSRAIPQGCAKPFRQAFDRGRSDRSKTDVDRAGPKVAGSRQTHGSSLCISRAWVGPDVTGSSTSGGIGRFASRDCPMASSQYGSSSGGEGISKCRMRSAWCRAPLRPAELTLRHQRRDSVTCRVCRGRNPRASR